MIRLLFLFACLSTACMADDRVSMVFTDARAVDLARVAYGEISREPFILSSEVLEAHQVFAVSLKNVERSTAVDSVRAILEGSGFKVAKRAGVVWIDKAQDSDDQVVVYKPRYRSARYLADVVQSVTAAKSVLSRSIKPAELSQSQGPQPMPASQTPALKQSSPTSVEGQIDRSEVDQIAFNVTPKDAAKVRKLLADLDTPSGEIMLKAAVYEVGVSKSEGSAVQLAVKIAGLSASMSGNLLSGASIKFAQGGIEAVLSALDADARFKSVSRPQVRVRNGAQARFSVGQDVPVLGAAQMDKNGNPVQSIDYKQSGVILTATPEIREDVIELQLQQELSNFIVTKTGVNGSPTLIKRAVNTKLGMVPGEVVMLAGLQDDQDDETQNRLPFLGWITGHERQNRRSEILVFIEVVRI